MNIPNGTKIRTDKGIFTIEKIEDHNVFIQENHMIVDIVTLVWFPIKSDGLRFKTGLEPTWARNW